MRLVSVSLVLCEDPARVAADFARIGSGEPPKFGRVDGSTHPRFFQSGMVLALYAGGEPAVVRLLSEMLGAPVTGGAMPVAPSPIPSPEGETTRVSWEEAQALIRSGAVRLVAQSHSLEVWLTLNDGRTVVTTEPAIDAVFEVIRTCGEPCANIAVATE